LRPEASAAADVHPEAMVVARALQTGASGRAIVAEQLAAADVLADDAQAAMAGLIHNRAFQDPPAASGVTLHVTGAPVGPSGLTLQADPASSSERVLGLGTYQPGQAVPTMGRILWDNHGHQHAELRVGPPDVPLRWQ
jgi:hypothetical protein